MACGQQCIRRRSRPPRAWPPINWRRQRLCCSSAFAGGTRAQRPPAYWLHLMRIYTNDAAAADCISSSARTPTLALRAALFHAHTPAACPGRRSASLRNGCRPAISLPTRRTASRARGHARPLFSHTAMPAGARVGRRRSLYPHTAPAQAATGMDSLIGMFEVLTMIAAFCLFIYSLLLFYTGSIEYYSTRVQPHP